MIKILSFILISELWITVGQICFKKSASLLDLHVVNGKEWIKDLIKVLFSSPVLIVGVVSMLAGLLFWLVALKAGDLSVVYSFRSMQFIFVLFASHFFLGERIDTMKVVGTVLITVGIFFIVIS
jgi:uncharacterized membrane protein